MLKQEKPTLKIILVTIMMLLKLMKPLQLCTPQKPKDSLTYMPLGYKTAMRNKELMMHLQPLIKEI